MNSRAGVCQKTKERGNGKRKKVGGRDGAGVLDRARSNYPRGYIYIGEAAAAAAREKMTTKGCARGRGMEVHILRTCVIGRLGLLSSSPCDPVPPLLLLLPPPTLVISCTFSIMRLGHQV